MLSNDIELVRLSGRDRKMVSALLLDSIEHTIAVMPMTQTVSDCYRLLGEVQYVLTLLPKFSPLEVPDHQLDSLVARITERLDRAVNDRLDYGGPWSPSEQARDVKPDDSDGDSGKR